MKWLEKYHERKTLPPVAYSELAYGYIKKYGSTDKLDVALHWADVRVGRMEQLEAFLAADIAAAIENPDLQKNFRDYMIAAFAYEPPTLLLTRDLRNFAFLGNRVLEPYAFMTAYGED